MKRIEIEKTLVVNIVDYHFVKLKYPNGDVC